MKSTVLILFLITTSFLSISQTKIDRINTKCNYRVLMHLKENTDISLIPNSKLTVYELNTFIIDISDDKGVYHVKGKYNAILSVSSEQLNGNIEQSVAGEFSAVVKEVLDDFIVTEFEPIKAK